MEATAISSTVWCLKGYVSNRILPHQLVFLNRAPPKSTLMCTVHFVVLQYSDQDAVNVSSFFPIQFVNSFRSSNMSEENTTQALWKLKRYGRFLPKAKNVGENSSWKVQYIYIFFYELAQLGNKLTAQQLANQLK